MQYRGNVLLWPKSDESKNSLVLFYLFTLCWEANETDKLNTVMGLELEPVYISSEPNLKDCEFKQRKISPYIGGLYFTTDHSFK